MHIYIYLFIYVCMCVICVYIYIYIYINFLQTPLMVPYFEKYFPPNKKEPVEELLRTSSKKLSVTSLSAINVHSKVIKVEYNP